MNNFIVNNCTTYNSEDLFMGAVQEEGIKRGYKWLQPPGDRLNIKMLSYQYRDSHVKYKTVSPTVLSLTWESPYLGKTVFILRRGPDTVGCNYLPMPLIATCGITLLYHSYRYMSGWVTAKLECPEKERITTPPFCWSLLRNCSTSFDWNRMDASNHSTPGWLRKTSCEGENC